MRWKSYACLLEKKARQLKVEVPTIILPFWEAQALFFFETRWSNITEVNRVKIIIDGKNDF